MGTKWGRHRSPVVDVLSGGVLLGVLSLVLACGDGGGPPSEAVVRETAEVELSQEPESAAPSLPPPGSATVSVENGRVTIRSHAASRLGVLRELAWRAGFSLEATELEPREITLVLVEVEPELALARLLGGEPYSLDYTAQAGGGHVIARVETGRRSAVAVEKADETAAARAHGSLREPGLESLHEEEADRAEDETARAARRSRTRLTGEQDARLRPPRTRGQSLTQEDWARLRDPEPEVRLEAVEDIDAMGEGVEQLIETLLADEDASVRAAAAEQLALASSEQATYALVDALRDPDPRVVVKAIEALMLADETVIPDLEPLESHPDASVRMAATEAIEHLE